METTIEGLGFCKVASWESAPGYAGIEMEIMYKFYRDYMEIMIIELQKKLKRYLEQLSRHSSSNMKLKVMGKLLRIQQTQKIPKP